MEPIHCCCEAVIPACPVLVGVAFVWAIAYVGDLFILLRQNKPHTKPGQIRKHRIPLSLHPNTEGSLFADDILRLKCHGFLEELACRAHAERHMNTVLFFFHIPVIHPDFQTIISCCDPGTHYFPIIVHRRPPEIVSHGLGQNSPSLARDFIGNTFPQIKTDAEVPCGHQKRTVALTDLYPILCMSADLHRFLFQDNLIESALMSCR